MHKQQPTDPFAGIAAGAPKGIKLGVQPRGPDPPPVTEEQKEAMSIKPQKVGFKPHADVYEFVPLELVRLQRKLR